MKDVSRHNIQQNTHTCKILLVSEFEFNTNTHTSKNRWEFEVYLFPRAWGVTFFYQTSATC